VSGTLEGVTMSNLKLTLLLPAGLLAFIFSLSPASSVPQDPVYLREHYQKKDYMIPMRDGVRLFTIVYAPKDTSQKYPIMLFRTPYSIPPYGSDDYRAQLGPSPEFDRDGYIFVFQDVRGKFRSEGEFLVMKPYKPDKKSARDTDESSDTYDTIDWLLRNLHGHNSRVGQWGISYPGWQTVMGMIDAHPALKASSPQASPSDMFLGDDFHHNGAFRLMYSFSWLAGNAQTRAGQSEQVNRTFDYGTPDGYKFFLDIGTVSRVNELYFQNRVPAWNEFMEHPNYDSYWQDQNALKDLKNIRPAVLNVAGWFDAEDFYGPTSIYYRIERENPSNRSTLVVGPWLHGGWSSMDGDSLGNIRFGSKTSLHYQKEVLFPFFSYHLKDRGPVNLPEAIVFQTGKNVWKTYDQWPPRSAVTGNLYFHGNGRLSFDAVTDKSPSAYDAYVSDPYKPVPFSAETRTTQGHLWMVEDQRFAASRPDVLVYQTDALREDITIAGPILASIHVATSGTDSDYVVKLIDVYPSDAPDNLPNTCSVKMGNFQMLLAGEVFRARFRNSYSKPEPMTPDQPVKLEFDLRDRNHTFLKGHRIMVQVQSSWFPVIDRNPQKFVDIYRASGADFRKATQRLYRSAQHPSHIKLNMLQ
jgi:putative CocE/NonD family hydrolase